jgi:DNA-binding transcriptional LysR family regulator
MPRPPPACAPPPALDWEHVRLFLAVAREGSLLGAAARLALDVSTVSRRLERLEGQLGAPLFDRGREGATPTALAEQMLPHAEEMENAAIRFASAGAQAETEVEGVVRVTAPPVIASEFVAPALPALYARHPRLTVELDASVGYANLTRREADVAIRAGRPSAGDLVAAKLLAGRASLLASPAYARALGRLRSFDDARWLTWAADLAHLPEAVWLRKHAPRARVALRTSHFASQLSAARAGLGVVITADPFARAGLVEIACAKALDAACAELPSGSLWLVGHRALRQVPRVAAVWGFLVDALGERGG